MRPQALSFFWAILLACSSLATASTSTPPSAEVLARHEARYEKLAHELRCLVCQNQSLAESGAELAGDLKREVRRMIAEEKSDVEIKAFLQARFGDFVLYDPPLKFSTMLLWVGPLLLLLMGALLARGVMPSRHQPALGEKSASTAESELDRLLK